MKFKEIPHSWLILFLMATLAGLRAFNIDTFVTASLSSVIGYLLGTKLEQTRKDGQR